MPDTVAGLFRSRPEAEEALRKLKETGFPDDQVSIATSRVVRRIHYGSWVAGGIVLGTVLGATVGAVVAGMVPGIHPLIPGNVLATFVLAAESGAAAGGVAGALFRVAVTGPRTRRGARTPAGGRRAIEAAPVEAPLEGGRPRPESG